MLRQAMKSDWDYILKLRNTPQSIANFYIQEKPIEKAVHYEYMEKQTKNPNFAQWIVIGDEQNIGYVRILENDVSIMIDEKFQNQGIGSKVLKLLEIEAKKLGINRLVAKILVHNKESQHIFEKNGYKLEMFWYEKVL